MIVRNHRSLLAERVAPFIYGISSAAASTITLQENPVPTNLVFIYSEEKTKKLEGNG